MKRHRIKGTSSAMLIVFVVSGIAISVLGFRQVHRLTTSPAWVAAGPLAAGQILTQDVLRKSRVKDTDNAINEPRALLGKQLGVAKEKGETFAASDLVNPPRSWLAQHAPEGRVLYTLTPQDSTIPHTQLRNGDRIDVLARGPGGVRAVAQDVLLVGALQPPANAAASSKQTGRGLLTSLAKMPEKNNGAERSGIPLVLAVKPEEVYPLASIGTGEIVTLVLHGEQEAKSGEFLDIRPHPTKRYVQVYNGLDKTNSVVNK